ncbi:MAG: GNAT family N-acetyltransferase [Gammaproteobacteria bacterium]|nr:GNAT family N-acetyltransferase [Gammaproteobacteria bacterium]
MACSDSGKLVIGKSGLNASPIQAAAVRLRRAHPRDAAELLALERHFPGDRLSPRAARRLLRSPSARIWLAEVDGRALAALVLLLRRGSGVARVYSLVVAPAVRGLGLARRLVALAEAEALRRGCTSMSLEVRADNAPARALYARLGYAEHARLPGYYEEGGDGLRLRKPLAGGGRGSAGDAPA